MHMLESCTRSHMEKGCYDDMMLCACYFLEYVLIDYVCCCFVCLFVVVLIVFVLLSCSYFSVVFI